MPLEPDGPIESHRKMEQSFHPSLVPPDQRTTFTIIVDGVLLDDGRKKAVEEALQSAVGGVLAEYSFDIRPLEKRTVGADLGGGPVGLQFVKNDETINQLLPD